MSRLARVLLLPYPPSIRREFGAEMSETLTAAWRDKPGVVSRMRLVVDLVRDAVASWRRTGPDARPSLSLPGGDGPSWSPLTGLGADLRSTMRLFLRSPLFAGGAVLTLALGIGATSAIFSLADATLLHPLPIRDPGHVWQVDFSWSYPSFKDLEASGTAFSEVAAWSNQRFGLEYAGESSEAAAAAVTGGYFGLTGLVPVAGRFIGPADDQPNAPIVVVLSERAWARLAGRNPAIVGSVIQINKRPATVIGIAPKNFRGLSLQEAPDLFVPLRAMSGLGSGLLGSARLFATRGIVWLQVVGRLRPDITPEQGRQAVEALYRRVDPPDPGTAPDPLTMGLVANRAFSDPNQKDPRLFVYVLLGATAVTLLLACATVANLLLVRAARRQREIALRSALGAGRVRLLRQVFIESLGIGLLGSLGGLAVAQGALTLVGSFDLPGRVSIGDLGLSLSPALLATSVGLGLVTSLIFGLGPAWHASRLDTQAALREGARGASRQPIRAILVGSQVALCVLLLLGGLAFGRAMEHALNLDLGFDTTHTALLTVSPSRARYAPARMVEAKHRIDEALAHAPWVVSSGWMAIAPLRGQMQWELGVPTASGLKSADFAANVVSAGYFDAMGIPLRAGRVFADATDTPTSPLAVIVNEAFVKKFFPNGNAMGTLLAMDGDGKDPKQRGAIVGIVGSVRHGIDEAPAPMFYVPMSQHLDDFNSTQTLVVRVRSSPASLLSSIPALIKGVEPGLPIGTPQTTADHLGAVLMPQRLGLTLFVLFAGLAAVLTTLGIYAVVAFAVSQRTREIGIRVALGAERTRVFGLVVRQGLRPVVLGGLAGAAAFAVASSGFSSLIFALPALTWASMAIVAAAVSVLAFGAMLVPARRALGIAPTEALRAE